MIFKSEAHWKSPAPLWAMVTCESGIPALPPQYTSAKNWPPNAWTPLFLWSLACLWTSGTFQFAPWTVQTPLIDWCGWYAGSLAMWTHGRRIWMPSFVRFCDRYSRGVSVTLIRWDKVFLETLQKMFLFYLRSGSSEEFLSVTAFVGATRWGWFGLCIESHERLSEWKRESSAVLVESTGSSSLLETIKLVPCLSCFECVPLINDQRTDSYQARNWRLYVLETSKRLEYKSFFIIAHFLTYDVSNTLVGYCR